MRVLDRLDELYAIGASRIGGSAEEQAAHDLAAGWMEAAGLAVEVDADGNLLGRFAGSGPEVWTGSHLDTVPNGGRFDGALGVVVSIEALERLGPQARPLAAVVFRDEERGCAGSRARRARGRLPASFVEVHIEQGPRLAAAGSPLGVVTGIVGYTRRTVVFEGRAGHAGTTPMDGREDALCRAAEYVLRVREASTEIGEAVGTVGRLDVEPGGGNVIPDRATVTVDLRAPDTARLGALLVSLGLEPEPITAPALMSSTIGAALGDELERRGLPVVELASGAGHDAGILATAGVESGMLFVRSLAGGVSHSPDELSSAEDIDLAIDVLQSLLLRLAS